MSSNRSNNSRYYANASHPVGDARVPAMGHPEAGRMGRQNESIHGLNRGPARESRTNSYAPYQGRAPRGQMPQGRPGQNNYAYRAGATPVSGSPRNYESEREKREKEKRSRKASPALLISSIIVFCLMMTFPLFQSGFQMGSFVSGLFPFGQDSQQKPSIALDVTLLGDVPAAATGPKAFDLSYTDTVSLDEQENERIKTLIEQLQEYGSISFAVVDVNTGLGISYNADKPMNAAECIHAANDAFIAQKVIDAGLVECELSEGITLVENAPQKEYSAILEQSITRNDHDCYSVLLDAFPREDFAQWLEDANVKDAADLITTTSYPSLSARNMLRIWCTIYTYINTSNTAASKHIKNAFASTEISPIRSALSYSETYASAEVFDKGSWANASSQAAGIGSLCDAGYIVYDGHTYLMTILTYEGMEGISETSTFTALVQELLSACHSLNQ